MGLMGLGVRGFRVRDSRVWRSGVYDEQYKPH